jgi:hypothetical protein
VFCYALRAAEYFKLPVEANLQPAAVSAAVAAAVPGALEPGQSRGVAGHQRVARSASMGRESTPQRHVHRTSKASIRSAIRTSMTSVFPGRNSEATRALLVKYRRAG